MAGNSGNAISFVGGLSEGFMKGTELRRSRDREARQDAIAAEDRARRNKESDLRTQQAELTLQGTQKKMKEAEDEQQRAAYEAGMRRRLAPLITGGNHRQALAEIERANNEDPHFDDGTVTEFEKGADGLPAVDANGQVKVRIKSKATGELIGETVASVGDENDRPEKNVYLSFFNRLQSPAEYNKAVAAEMENRRAAAAAEAKRSADLEDYKNRKKVDTDERIRLTKEEARLGVKGGKAGGQATKEERLVEMYRRLFPKESNDQIMKRVNAGKLRDPQSMRVDLIKAYMASNYGSTAEEAKKVVDKAFPEFSAVDQPGGVMQSDPVDDVATGFGF